MPEHASHGELSAIYAAVFLPLAYAANLLAVVIHEVLGQGLAAILFGGTLHGVVVRWDGMGYVSTSLPADCSPVLQMLQLAAGPLATIAVGVPIFLVGLRVSTKSKWKLPLVVAGTVITLEGLPYLFFNSLFPRPPGHLGRIFMIWQTPLKPLDNLSGLESITFYESTNILDGDLLPMVNQKNLSRLSFQNRRHYSRRREEFVAYNRPRTSSY